MDLPGRIASLLFPPRCMFCRRILDEGWICPSCREGLPRCGAIRGHGEFFSKCVAPLYYTGAVRSALLGFKFRGKRGRAVGLGELMAQTVREELAGEFDTVTWVPISARRLWARGFDQSELLCRETAGRLGVTPVRALRKIRHTAANSTVRTPEGRAANVLGAYEVTDPGLVRGRRVLLIDDIRTTGATLSECARTLLTAGAAEVVCAVAAAAPSANRWKKGR